MTTEHTLERIQSVNAVPSTDSFPQDAWSTDALLARIDERSTIVTDLKTAPSEAPEKKSRWSGPAIALAVAAAILLVVGAISVLTTSGSDQAPVDTVPPTTAAPTTTVASTVDATATPYEVALAYGEAYAAGDYARYEALLDPESQGLFAGLNGNRRSSTYHAVTGMSSDHECVADANTVTCTTIRQSGLDPSVTYPPFEIVFTVESGLITDLTTGPAIQWTFNADAEQIALFSTWVEANRADAFDTIFDQGSLVFDTEEQRALIATVIAEYQAATG